ncbi:putative transmembrane anti-sigma factor [Desulforamulus reducens MI-1]|uniref:Anti-sigma-W factor RsiW n=1 Tax=Desulforamulus reducens (strain ATCC BAA-1160 / DSM 100696 / MI-1) TaxID=349161 RepID=A4J6U2_DESRM|nr:zf-HC2 domain-containing protein [Desulforamulus reducens]ABO50795.1 putative transmembrane anti-sigma factor [Desulforamulus reducens MI-1]
MQCHDILGMLSPYLDGVLNSEECNEVRVHLASCLRCRAEFEELQATVLLLQELPELTPPVDFREKLMERIDHLSTHEPNIAQKGWLARITDITRSAWYRTVAVAAVMVMTLGVTSLWQKEVHPLLPVTPAKQGITIPIPGQEPQSTEPKPNKTNKSEPPKGQEPNASVSPMAPGNSGEPENGSAVKNSPKTSAKTGIASSAKQVESFVPSPNEGLVENSMTMKLDVNQVEESLKAINQIVQVNGASITVPYYGTNEGGTLEIKVTRNSYGIVSSSLQKLGAVVNYLPVEKDLSVQHKQATEILTTLKQRQAELEQRVTEVADDQLQQQLAQVNASLAEQVNVIKQIEERSTYCLITVTLI